VRRPTENKREQNLNEYQPAEQSDVAHAKGIDRYQLATGAFTNVQSGCA